MDLESIIKDVVRDCIEDGCTAEETASSISFAVHEEMVKEENIFKPFPFIYIDAAEIKNFFIFLRRENKSLPYPLSVKYSYHDYLGSYYWRILSLFYRTYIQDSCEKCGRTSRLHVHHKTYKLQDGSPVFGKEYLLINTSDNCLSTLCADCHSEEHGIEDNEND